MTKKGCHEKVIVWFQGNASVAEMELHYNSPYELLIAVILSAQYTDKRVSMITPRIYRGFPTLGALAATAPEVIFKYTRSASYPNNKSKCPVDVARMLVSDPNGEVPGTLEEPIKLPGVGCKTANAIQSIVFNKTAMVADIYVLRVNHCIGFVGNTCTTFLSVEKELTKNTPSESVPITHHWLILHGRYVYRACTPGCETCGLQLMCKYYHEKYKVSKDIPKRKNK